MSVVQSAGRDFSESMAGIGSSAVKAAKNELRLYKAAMGLKEANIEFKAQCEDRFLRAYEEANTDRVISPKELKRLNRLIGKIPR